MMNSPLERMTARGIVTKTFTTKRKGYDQAEVDGFLVTVARAFEAQNLEIDQMTNERLQESLTQYPSEASPPSSASSLSEVHGSPMPDEGLDAEWFVEAAEEIAVPLVAIFDADAEVEGVQILLQAARKTVELTLADARARAEAILEDARQRASEMTRDTDRRTLVVAGRVQSELIRIEDEVANRRVELDSIQNFVETERIKGQSIAHELLRVLGGEPAIVPEAFMAVPAEILLAGRVACVAGAASLVGACVARTLAAAGAHVVLGDDDADGLSAITDELVAAGASVSSIRVGVRHRNELDRFVLDTVERFGRLDIMCNVAGVTGIGSLAEVTESEIDDAIATQVKGALFGCQAALTAMAPRAAGSIINVSTVSRNAFSPVLGVTAAARAAVANLTQSFAVEASRRGVRVNAFEVDADYASTPPSYDSLVEQLRSLTRLEELAAVDEHAHHLLYLCGESSKFVTGTLVRAGVRADR